MTIPRMVLSSTKSAFATAGCISAWPDASHASSVRNANSASEMFWSTPQARGRSVVSRRSRAPSRIALLTHTLRSCAQDQRCRFIYFGLAVMAWEPQFSTMGRGATNQTELSPAAIGETEILMPHKTVLRQFEEFAEPI